MKDIVVAAVLIAVGVIGLSNADTIEHLYMAAYPQSAAQSRALDRCAASENGFDRLDAGARERCYAKLQVPPSVQLVGSKSEP